MFTLCGSNISFNLIFQPEHQYLKEGTHHGKEHPHIDHLDISSAWQLLADANETEKEYLFEKVVIAKIKYQNCVSTGTSHRQSLKYQVQ